MRRFAIPILLTVAVGLLLLGCVRLPSPRPSNTQYYLLNSSVQADTAITDSTGLRLGLRKPRLADYLDTSRNFTDGVKNWAPPSIAT